VDSTCSESGLSGRAKGIGDRDDLTKGRVVLDGEDGRASQQREKNLRTGVKERG
jgi:hypothetical protein